jgi:hypothetical protein
LSDVVVCLIADGRWTGVGCLNSAGATTAAGIVRGHPAAGVIQTPGDVIWLPPYGDNLRDVAASTLVL